MFELLNKIGNVQISTLNKILNGNVDSIIKQNENENIYFLGCVKDGVQKRASDNDIEEKNYIYFDLDVAKTENATDEEIKWFAKSLPEILQNTIFEDWNSIIYTGNGIHIYYLGDFVKVDKLKWSQAMKYLVREIQKIVKTEVDSACVNPARISRLPLSYNNKGEKKLVEIIEQRDKKTDLIKNIYSYSTVIQAEEEIQGILYAIKQQSKGEKGFDLIEQINNIPVADEVLKDYPNWKFDGKNFWDQNNRRASSAWVNESNVLIKSDSRWINGSAKGFCTYLYRKAQSNLTDKETFDYFRKEYNLKPKVKVKNDDFDKIEDKRKPFTWGTENLDDKISPIEKEHFNIIAGETGAGKTAYSFDMAIKNAQAGHRVLYLSLEMSTDSIFTRIARGYSGITKSQWRTKNIADSQKIAYYRKKRELKSIENLIAVGMETEEDTSPNSITKIILKYEPDIVFIDNFDLISRHDNISETQSEGEISKFFKDFALVNKIPVIMIHHFKKKTGKIDRTIDDLRGSGKIGHNSYTTVYGYRTQNAETKKELSEFTILELKSRDFGEYGIATIYFHKGTFYDDYLPNF